MMVVIAVVACDTHLTGRWLQKQKAIFFCWFMWQQCSCYQLAVGSCLFDLLLLLLLLLPDKHVRTRVYA